MRPKDELTEFYKCFALDGLYFALFLEKFFKYSYLKIYWLFFSLILMLIPMFYYYERVLKHPVWFVFLFAVIHSLFYKLVTRNEKQMNIDYKKSCVEIEIINDLIKTKKDEKSKFTIKNS